jgi:hypothetical protein
MNRNERPSTQELTSDQKLLLVAIKDSVDGNNVEGGKGYFLCLQATAVLFEPDITVAYQQLTQLLDLGYIRFAIGTYSVDITEKGRRFLKSLEVGQSSTLTEQELGKPGIWDRFSGWFVVNILLRLYKYKE